jgi:DNA adenine methylase
MYCEPFLGGGSIFFSSEPKRALLADKNRDLIAMYLALQSSVEDVIAHLRDYPYERDFYYKIRSSRPTTPSERAARFIYLNRSCWNGLYRVNRKGDFNTPFGTFTNPSICDAPRLRAANRALSRATLVSADFSAILQFPKRGSLVYCDPPYITGHTNNGFIKYNQHLFNWNDQLRLSRDLHRLAQEGVHVLLSNSLHDAVLDLYRGFHIIPLERNSLIAASAGSRSKTTEALISSFPIAR